MDLQEKIIEVFYDFKMMVKYFILILGFDYLLCGFGMIDGSVVNNNVIFATVLILLFFKIDEK